MKVLLTGGSGQVGQEIIKSKPEGIEIISPSRKKLDLSDYISCKKFVIYHKPDWIINSGAYTQVDDAEKNIQLSQKINGYALEAFVEAINEINGNLLQLSTDYVFDGKQNYPYKENQNKNPLSQYGFSKALGEELIKKNIKNINNATILRTSWVISPRGKNFILKMLKLHSEKKYIDVVSDQTGSPTSAADLGKVCWEIIKFKNKRNLPFIMHWRDDGIASWFDIADAIGDIAKELKIIERKAKINPIKSKEYLTLAKRPKYSVLDTLNTAKLLDIKPTHWKENLRKILIEYQKK
tara:strand:+ start:899 stop:1783 length:885 start_codon:yes stop_codon:yes gene_type:complete